MTKQEEAEAGEKLSNRAKKYLLKIKSVDDNVCDEEIRKLRIIMEILCSLWVN